MAGWTGLEPATSGVTGRHSKPTELPPRISKKNSTATFPTEKSGQLNRLNYHVIERNC